MLSHLSHILKQHLTTLPLSDQIIFNRHQLNINPENFHQFHAAPSSSTISFLDGGQAEIVNGGSFCLSFIRIAAQTFQGKSKKNFIKNEFYLFTKAVWKENEVYYESALFPLHGEKIINEQDLLISAHEDSIKIGNERASINQVISMTRRFAELTLASQSLADTIILDGTLQATFAREEQYLSKLGMNVAALAKTSSLFTTAGNNPAVLLARMGPRSSWSYLVNGKTYFVKLHPQAKHIFRFEGDPSILPMLAENSRDALFLGYPYGLILTDQLARVSNIEKESLRAQFLLRSENREIREYLASTDAHEILDHLS